MLTQRFNKPKTPNEPLSCSLRVFHSKKLIDMINLPVVLAYQAQVDYHNAHADGTPWSRALEDPLLRSTLQSACIPLNEWSRSYSWLEGSIESSNYTVAFGFNNLVDFAGKIRSPIALNGTLQGLCNDSISSNIHFRKLIIDAHGDPGIVYMAGLNNRNDALRFDNVLNNQIDIMSVFRRVFSGGSVMFTSCHTGEGANGTVLLQALSSMVRNIYFIAFSSYNIMEIQDNIRTYHSAVFHPVTQQRIRPSPQSTSAYLHSSNNPNAKIYLNGLPIQIPASERRIMDFDRDEATVVHSRQPRVPR